MVKIHGHHNILLQTLQMSLHLHEFNCSNDEKILKAYAGYISYQL